LIYTKDMLLAPLLPGMEQPPHPMRLGDEHDYYARGPELLRDAPAGQRARGADGAVASEAEERGAAGPVAAPAGSPS
jgi:NADH-quinone oxidoreductase subunit I